MKIFTRLTHIRDESSFVKLYSDFITFSDLSSYTGVSLNKCHLDDANYYDLS